MGFLMVTVHLARLSLPAPFTGRSVFTTCPKCALIEPAAVGLPLNVATILTRRLPAANASLAVKVMTWSSTLMQLLKSTASSRTRLSTHVTLTGANAIAKEEPAAISTGRETWNSTVNCADVGASPTAKSLQTRDRSRRTASGGM
jgi:hypothetical protein